MKSRGLHFIEIIRKIFVLPPALTVAIALPSFALVIAALNGMIKSEVVKYIAYIASAYAMIISVTGFLGIVAMIRQGVKSFPLVKKLEAIPIVEKFFKEKLFRTELAQFSSADSSSSRLLITSITGAGINLIVLGMVVFMILRSGSLLRQYHSKQNDINTEDNQ